MTPKQQRFVDEYLIDLNATQAAIRAGYSARSAKGHTHRLLQDPEIRNAIDAAQAARRKRTELTADWVVERLRIEAERTGEGSSHSARVAALGWAMKLLGLCKEDAPHPDHPPIDLSKLTDEQKRATLAALRSAMGRPDPSRPVGARDGADALGGGPAPPG
ncbi:terminase small subunit [Frigoriglobus tundricola]|uniref:terminase small subunit n=1 Tax=Frigoriglobus tundricola TaxID=2774151 RepID=UPI00148EDBD0|nr:terminase small subunit [Frigoriglobus tundricola]